jgi:hypothetical protein
MGKDWHPCLEEIHPGRTVGTQPPVPADQHCGLGDSTPGRTAQTAHLLGRPDRLSCTWSSQGMLVSYASRGSREGGGGRIPCLALSGHGDRQTDYLLPTAELDGTDDPQSEVGGRP